MSVYEDLEMIAREADEKVRRLREFGASLATRTHVFPIANHLGSVTVSGNAELLAINLDTSRLGSTRPDLLGDAIVHAINIAEDTVASRVAAETANLTEGKS